LGRDDEETILACGSKVFYVMSMCCYAHRIDITFFGEADINCNAEGRDSMDMLFLYAITQMYYQIT
jgi:hypothetical protein